MSRKIRRTKPGGVLSAGSRLGSFFCTWALVLLWPAFAQAYQERLILTVTEGDCSLRVEADEQSQTLRLRLLPESPRCHFTKTTMQRILKEVFSKTDPPKLEGVYVSLFLGRLVEYPWLSEQLALSASRDPHWDKEKGRPRSLNPNAYVKERLSKKEVTDQFDETFGESGYRVVAVAVEKVLVGRRGDVPVHAGTKFSGKAPYDAMVWLVLGRM
ncbi:hypothetical protein [uncultured Desulfobulbus sp.]|uniref:hypothetical protein n=1 Tax=uncultured Desulfobulbus sp. TaxID=239745 RepID=UPI0029C74DAE|nr:hypothetical protein [uncultured Desulfobulbus sp.]